MLKTLQFTIVFFLSIQQIYGQCASCGTPSTYGQIGLSYVWVGGQNAAGAAVALGSGEYNNACNWRISATTGSLATWDTPCQPPQSHNDVHFLAASFPSASTITISGDASCRKMIWDDAISPSNKPTVTSPNSTTSNPTKLDIYNELYLTTTNRLAFNFSGSLRMNAQGGGNVPFTSQGQRFLLCSVRFAAAAGTTIVLQDNLHVDDIAQANNNSDASNQGFIYMESGGFNTNGKSIRTDFFFTNNANASRALNISNSTITLGGNSTNTWMCDFLANTSFVPTNYTSFTSTGSNVVLQGIAGVTTGFTGGTRVTYDRVTVNTPLNTINAIGTYIISGAPILNELYILKDMMFHSLPITVNTIYIEDGVRCRFNDGRGVTPKVILDNLVVLNDVPCKPVWMIADAARPFFMKKSNAGGTTLTFNEVVLHEANADVTGGYSYVANNSWQVGVKTNWTINSSASCPCRRMRFHDRNNNQDWHTVSNWDVWDGSAWVTNTGEVPFICDDVEFDDMAFTNNAGTPNANKFVKILAPAHCRNMSWVSAVNTDAQLRQERIWGILNIYGSFTTHPNFMSDFIYSYTNPATNAMTYSVAVNASNVPTNTTQSFIDFWGGFDVATNTVQPANISTGDASNCVHILPYVRLRRGSYYNVQTRYTGRAFQALPGSTLYTNGTYMRLLSLLVDNRFMHNSDIYLVGSNTSATNVTEWTFYDYGSFSYNPAASPGQTHYTGSTTFHFQPNAGTYSYVGGNSGTKTYSGIAYGQPSQLPNAIFYGELGGLQYDMIVHGDLDMREDAKLYYPTAVNVANRLLVTGSMGGSYTGSVTLTRGKTYTFSSGLVNSRITINGNFTAIGSCSEPIVVRTLNGNAIPVKISGSSTIEEISLSGWNNTGNPIITANNSVDAGANTNIAITSGAPRTFYWRARQGSAGLGANAFSGNWSDPRFWAINVSDVEGGAGCIPTLRDVVIFDNASGPSTDTCYIDGNSPAGTLWYQNTGIVSIACPRVSPASANHTPSFGTIQIGQNLWIDKDATNQFKHYTGSYEFIANGLTAGNTKQIKTSGTILYTYRMTMADAAATLSLQDALSVLTPSTTIQTYTTVGGNYNYGVLMLLAGTLNLNNQAVRIGNQFVSVGALTRTLQLTNSIVTVECNGTNYPGSSINNSQPWMISGTNLTITTGTGSLIDFLNNTIPNHYPKTFSMGTVASIRYNDVIFRHTDESILLSGSTTYRNLEFLGEASIDNSNTMDKLTLAGGFFYRFLSGKTQTLTAPNGTLVCNSSLNNFTNIETYGGTAKSFFHKDWGTYICLDFVKVKDNNVTRNNALCAANGTLGLYFYTGQNSDNINNSAGGYWNFTLGLANHVIVSPDEYSCQSTASGFVDINLSITGAALDGYSIEYCHYDDANNLVGCNSTVVNDDDNNPLTPFVFTVNAPIQNNHYYVFDVAVLRCGGRSASVEDTAYIFVDNPNILVAQNRHADCYLTNQNVWVDFYDEIDHRPIASILDYTGAGDTDMLQLVDVFVDFDPTITTCLARPRLQRYWQITPQNNKAAYVRLYFTQAELDALAAATNNSVVIPSDLELWKFTDGQLCAATPTLVPFTQVDLSASSLGQPNDKAFSSVNNIYAIEFIVTSFSHFVLVPDSITLLATKLLSFNASANAQQRQTELSWLIGEHSSLDFFEVERSQDGYTFHRQQTISAQNTNEQTVAYQTIDPAPLAGLSYYRLKIVDKDGQVSYSPQRAVSFDGTSVITVFPVPVAVNNQLNVRLQVPENTNLQAWVVDMLGRELQQHSIAAQGGTLQTWALPLGSLPAASYHLKIADGLGNVSYHPFVVKD